MLKPQTVTTCSASTAVRESTLIPACLRLLADAGGHSAACSLQCMCACRIGRLAAVLLMLLEFIPACNFHASPAVHKVTSMSLPAARGSVLLEGPAPADTPLLIAAEDDAAPWSNPDGTGYANDVVQAAFQAAGHKIDMQVVPYARAKQMALDGTAAACFSMSRLPELEAAIAFPDQALFILNAEYFESVLRPLPAHQESQLPIGTRIGVVIGYEYPPSVYHLQQAGRVTLEESLSEELILKKLAAGRIDAALLVCNQIKSADFLIRKAGVQGQVRNAFSSGALSCYIGFSRKHARGLLALAWFNEGYRKIAGNGVLDKIKQDWENWTRSSGTALPQSQPKGEGLK